MKEEIFLIKFMYLDRDIGFNGEDIWNFYEIKSNILLLHNDIMVLNDLSNTYIHEWELRNIKKLEVEIIK